MSISALTATHREALDTFLKVGAHQIATQGVPGHQSMDVSFASLAAIDDNQNATHFPVESLFHRHTDAGPLEYTGNATDVAAVGGLFQMMSPNGEKVYTANGQGIRNASGEWVNALGYRFLDDGGSPLVLPSDFAIQEDGSIVDGAGNLFARVGVVEFSPEDAQLLEGEVFLRPKAGTAPTAFPADNAQVLQGHLMGSNGSVPEMMAAMMYAQNAREGTLQLAKSDLSLANAAVDALLKV